MSKYPVSGMLAWYIDLYTQRYKVFPPESWLQTIVSKPMSLRRHVETMCAHVRPVPMYKLQLLDSGSNEYEPVPRLMLQLDSLQPVSPSASRASTISIASSMTSSPTPRCSPRSAPPRRAPDFCPSAWAEQRRRRHLVTRVLNHWITLTARRHQERHDLCARMVSHWRTWTRHRRRLRSWVWNQWRSWTACRRRVRRLARFWCHSWPYRRRRAAVMTALTALNTASPSSKRVREFLRMYATRPIEPTRDTSKVLDALLTYPEQYQLHSHETWGDMFYTLATAFHEWVVWCRTHWHGATPSLQLLQKQIH